MFHTNSRVRLRIGRPTTGTTGQVSGDALALMSDGIAGPIADSTLKPTRAVFALTARIVLRFARPAALAVVRLTVRALRSKAGL